MQIFRERKKVDKWLLFTTPDLLQATENVMFSLISVLLEFVPRLRGPNSKKSGILAKLALNNYLLAQEL